MKSRYTVVLSEHIIPDTDIYNGGGTERTKEIQAILDTAVEKGGLHLIVDGAYMTDTLRVHSHTTIECVNETCGFFLKDHSSKALITNANICPKGERVDKDIIFIGGTYNFNCLNQEHHLEYPADVTPLRQVIDYANVGFKIFGVDNLKMFNVVLRDQRAWAFICGNSQHVYMENIRIDLPHHMPAQNQDGLHFFGESRFITLKNISGRAGDDFIAISPDEFDGESSITDVLIDGVHLDNSDQAIRLLNAAHGKLDRVIIKNVTGTYKSYGFFINPWIWPRFCRELEGGLFKNYPLTFGNFGSITLENIDLRQEGKLYTYSPNSLFRLGGYIKSLRMRNVNWVNAGYDADFMQIGGHYVHFTAEEDECITKIDNLILENIEIHSENGVKTRGIVHRAAKVSNVKNFTVSGLVSDVPTFDMEGGEIENLYLSKIYSPNSIPEKLDGVKNIIK